MSKAPISAPKPSDDARMPILNSDNISFSLPNTPPKINIVEKISLKEILGLDALALIKNKSYLIFFISSILVCIPLAFYYQHTNQFLNEVGIQAAASKMVLGQI